MSLKRVREATADLQGAAKRLSSAGDVWFQETPPPSPEAPRSHEEDVDNLAALARIQSGLAAACGSAASGSSVRETPAQRHDRLNVLHSTVAKLGQHRTMCDPRLRHSVLLYNTVRLIERQLNQEGVTLATALHPHHDAAPPALDDVAPPPVVLPTNQDALPAAPIAIEDAVAMETEEMDCESADTSGSAGTNGGAAIDWSSLLTLGDPMMDSVEEQQSWPLAPLGGNVLWRVPEGTVDSPDQCSCLMQL